GVMSAAVVITSRCTRVPLTLAPAVPHNIPNLLLSSPASILFQDHCSLLLRIMTSPHRRRAPMLSRRVDSAADQGQGALFHFATRSCFHFPLRESLARCTLAVLHSLCYRLACHAGVSSTS